MNLLINISIILLLIINLNYQINALNNNENIDTNSLNTAHKHLNLNSPNNIKVKKHRKNHARLVGRKNLAPEFLEFPSQDLRRSLRNKVVNIPNHWEKIPYIFQTYNEPEQFYQMPALSNGFIGTTAKNNSIYVNGLYNGFQDRSHRVRIPSMTSVEAFFSISTDNEISTYHFDCRRGVYSVESKNNEAIITQRFYVHRRLKNIIVNEIRVELLTRTPITIETLNLTLLDLNTEYINSPMNPNRYSYYTQHHDPENMTFEHRVIKEPTNIGKRNELNDGVYYLQATIPQTEVNNRRQKQIHTYYTNVPSKFTIYPNTTVKTFHLIQSVDSDNFRAKNAYEEAVRMIQQDPNSLYVLHTSAWEEIWQKSGFAMIGEGTYSDANQEAFKLAQRLYSSFYGIYSSLPSNFDNQFYGLSPAGLAYGGLKYEFYNNSQNTQFSLNRQVSEAYGGHVMYNQELWMLPLTSMFNQDISKTIINSRLRRGLNTDHMNLLDQAREAAKQEGYQGLRYPWEQGDYGVDVSPYQDARKNKIHTSADISFGIRSYLRSTHSREFLQQSISSDASLRGEEYLQEIAKYWNDRFDLDIAINQYVIKGVSFGEKPQTREVDNEAFTNYIGSLSMDTYKYSLYLCDKNPYEGQYSVTIREYDDKINRVKIPYDNLKKLYLEYDNFYSQQNEEAWAPYLNFPLQKRMTYAEKKILYDTYASQLQNEGKSLLSYSSFVVGYLELNEEKKAQDYMTKMSNHFNEPFMVMSEFTNLNNNLNPQNTFNFLPGYAAYATAFIAGFCGIRYRDFQLDLVYPSENFKEYLSQMSSSQFPIFKQPAVNTEVWNITGLLYRGNKLDIIYNLRSKSVEIRNRRANELGTTDDTLEIVIYEGTNPVYKSLKVGETVTISLSTEIWNYAPKKNRLQKNSYSNNINILASIYSSQFSKHLHRPTNFSLKIKYEFSILAFMMFLVVFFKC